MGERITLKNKGLKQLRVVNPMLVSYNVEFAEVTGGTFWKAYTPEQVEGKEPFHVDLTGGGLESMYRDLMQVYPPIDLKNEKLRKLTKNLGPAWVRVSGTWATKTYYDFDGKAGGKAPEGYMNVLTKDQWLGLLDFVREVNGKLLISVSNCAGLHKAEEPWNPSEAEKIFRLSEEYGVPIQAVEFTNEPAAMEETGFPENYDAACYRRDHDLFYAWVKEKYPDCLCVGPCACGGDVGLGKASLGDDMGGIAPNMCTCDDLMNGTKTELDVFSYHCYNGISERIASIMPESHWDVTEANSEAYLDVAPNNARIYSKFRDKYVPGAEMWVTEAGDAGGGGNTWASTYLDVLRNLNELGSFVTVTDGVIFHNTLASSDYGFLEKEVFDPRPNYFGVLLWNRLMGTTVYDSEESVRMGAHVYAHSRKDKKDGIAYLIINNDLENTTSVELPGEADVYMLAGENGNMRSTVMTLNGNPLVLKEGMELPELQPVKAEGEIEVTPGSCAFILV